MTDEGLKQEILFNTILGVTVGILCIVLMIFLVVFIIIEQYGELIITTTLNIMGLIFCSWCFIDRNILTNRLEMRQLLKEEQVWKR